MKLLSEDNMELICALLENKALGALSEDRLRILELLAKEPMYPAQVAKIIGMQVQSVYYHVRLLEKAGLVEFREYEEKHGAVAKKYSAKSDSIAVVLNNSRWKLHAGRAKSREPPKLLAPFVHDGHFDGKIVLGSPDPHGKYRSRGSELCMVEIAMLLGQHATFSFPLYLLDTEVKEADKKQNLILAGGPKVNMLVAEINHALPINFKEETFDIFSNLSGKRYGENAGVIELVDNPFAKGSKILLIGGLNYHGTRAAVLSIFRKMKEIEAGNAFKPSVLAKVVEGYDENGDGVVDAIEILE